MNSSAFRTPEDEQRYRNFFDRGHRYWKLDPDEHRAAEEVFRHSPTLRPFREILNHETPSLDMYKVGEAAQQSSRTRVVLAAALTVITIPNLAWAFAGDPTWTSVADQLTAEDLEALAAAKRLRT